MKISSIQTPLFTPGDDLLSFIQTALGSSLPEKSVVVVTSKIVALSENRVIPVKTDTKAEKHSLVKQEADAYIPETDSQYELLITRKNHTIAVNAGIDRSNAADNYILLPENPYHSARKIWSYLRKSLQVKQLGVIITDSKTFPLQWGVTGTALGHCGFRALNDHVGEEDLFGREIQMTKVNVRESLAVAAVLEMGETSQSQPLAVVTQAEMVQFQDQPPTPAELSELDIDPADDVYAPMIQAAEWKMSSKN